MITITDRAAAKIREVLEENHRTPETVVLRMAVMGGGCSGFQYAPPTIEETPQETDQVLKINGIRVAIDPISASYLKGAELDFVEPARTDELNLVGNPQGGGFKITNPNAKSTCGCGQSFEPN